MGAREDVPTCPNLFTRTATLPLTCLTCLPPAVCVQHPAACEPRVTRGVQRGQAHCHHLLISLLLPPGQLKLIAYLMVSLSPSMVCTHDSTVSISATSLMPAHQSLTFSFRLFPLHCFGCLMSIVDKEGIQPAGSACIGWVVG